MRRAFLLCVMAVFCLCGAAHDGVAADGSGVGAYGSAATKGVKSSVEGELKETMNSAQEAYNTAAQTTYEEMIPKPEEIQDQASSCLDGIMDTNFGFGLNVPSVSNLLGAACNKINSGIKDHLQEASAKINPKYMNGLISSEMGIGLGGKPAPASRVNYERQGERISNRLWESVKQEKTWLK